MKYAGHIQIVDDEGEIAFERELSADEMIDALTAVLVRSDGVPVRVTKEDPTGILQPKRHYKTRKQKDVRGGKSQGKAGLGRPDIETANAMIADLKDGSLKPRQIAEKYGVDSRVVYNLKRDWKKGAFGEKKGAHSGAALDAEEAAWNSYQAPLSRINYSDIKDLVLDGKNAVQILAELDIQTTGIDEVNFVIQSKNYEGYISVSRKNALG